jgi:hypothetical protein
MLDNLKSYLQHQGFDNIFLDFMPPVEKCINAIDLAEWNNVPNNDGSATHYIQVQVRRAAYDTAKLDCKHIMELLDSGTDETLIWLTSDVFCIATPRRGATILSRGEGYTTFYGELALWG